MFSCSLLVKGGARSMKKILLITLSDNADHQDATFGLFEELLHNSVFLMAISKPKVKLNRTDNVLLVDCPKRPGICKKTFDIFTLFSIIRRIRREKFDYIYFESLHLWNLPIMIFSNNSKIYHVIHEVIPHEGDKSEKMVHIMNKVIVRLADKIVLRNEKYVDEMKKQYNISKDMIMFTELWRRFPEFTEPSYSKKVLFFGRINPYKGADNLIEIVKLCPNIHFKVIGRVDPQMKELMRILSCEKNVELNNDYVSDEEMAEAFIEADWVILPYNSASQSGVVIDAYKYSRPVIAFDVGAISEQIADGKSGYLIEEKNNRAFAEILNKVIKLDKKEYFKMCTSAYNYGLEKYATSRAEERFMQLLGIST